MNGCFRLTMLFIVPLLCGGWFCVMSWFILMDHTAWSVVDITPLVAVGGAGVGALALGAVVAARSRWDVTRPPARPTTLPEEPGDIPVTGYEPMLSRNRRAR
ncbi:MAG: hypothetical protein Kow00120_30030 [Anaerolineae bacterium]